MPRMRAVECGDVFVYVKIEEIVDGKGWCFVKGVIHESHCD
jgi:hypothetical protein